MNKSKSVCVNRFWYESIHKAAIAIAEEEDKLVETVRREIRRILKEHRGNRLYGKYIITV